MPPRDGPFDYQEGLLARSKGDKIHQGHALGIRPAWLLIILLVVTAIVTALILVPHFQPPMHLSQTSLIGPRPPIPRNFVLLRDDSGSFVDYEAIRDDSIQQVLTWAPGNLRDDDTITVISFAGESLVTLPPTTVADLIDSKTEPIREVATGDDTQIIPALQATRDVLKEHPHPTSIIIITDTLIHDVTSGQVDDLLGELSVMSLSVILPTGMSVDPTWSTQFDWAADFHAEPGDSASTALAVGEALAHATGQALQSS